MDVEKLSLSAYNDLVIAHPEKKFPVEQSPQWGAFQDTIPGRHFLGMFALQHKGTPIALVSPLQLTMKGYSYIWVNQGPIWLVEPTPEAVQQVTQALRHIVTQHATKPILFVRAHFPSKPPSGLPAYSQSLIQKTTIVDLTQPFDQVLATMSQGGRRAMRKAQKAGISISEVPAAQAAEDFSPYYQILRETATRDGFFVHPESTYVSMLTELKDVVRFFVARNSRNEPVAWALDTSYNHHAIYYYGASNEEGRDAQAPYLLHIEIMKRLQNEGVAAYDFLGIGSKSYPGLQGVTQFKLRFGGPEVDYVPTYDIPLKAQYRPWKWAQKLKYRLRK